MERKYKETGNRAMAFRRSIDYTQKDLAEALGTTKKTLSRVENGHIKPGIDYVKKMTERFGLNATWLFTGEGQPFMKVKAKEKDIKDRVLDLEANIDRMEGDIRQLMAMVDSLIKILEER